MTPGFLFFTISHIILFVAMFSYSLLFPYSQGANHGERGSPLLFESKEKTRQTNKNKENTQKHKHKQRKANTKHRKTKKRKDKQRTKQNKNAQTNKTHKQKTNKAKERRTQTNK